VGEPSPRELASHPVRKRGLKRHPSPPGLRAVIIPLFSGNVLNAQHNIRAARVIAATLLAAGSSPRARGTHSKGKGIINSARVIPACAGNTPVPPAAAAGTAGHPRVRGEHICAITVARSPVGSSPRARGTRSLCRTLLVQGRVIPACAGNTGPHQVGDAEIAGHPRVRGEHAISGCAAKSQLGSSPRARGTRASRLLFSVVRRVIPACAGNTWRPRPPPPAWPGHPRVRGEHGAGLPQRSHRCGSSPRARGTPFALLPQRGAGRVIPACAGNTHSKRIFRPLFNFEWVSWT